MVTVSCCELAPQVGDLAGNVRLATLAIEAAVRDGADVVVLPELATSGYVFESPDEARGLAVGRDDALFERWRAAAGSAVVVAGFAELGDDGEVYNSAVLLHPGGAVVYRKTHLWDREKLFFTPGAELPPVVDTVVGRIGVMVCYDLEFPELTRSVALRGAELLAVPTNWPWGDRPAGQPCGEIIIAMAAARVNRLPIACCDRRGVERGQRWNQATAVIDEQGWPVADALADGVATARLDLTRAADKRISPRNDLLADRRTDLYP
ncbi:MAG: nitrilase-related carbon-nitrogen hydrolase [Jatrophihabitans sp.]|uniref:nitrilase-related carbon-nitrogen hydrolase n=1 Tax=Jatrophihabitans sp. TaxID=1932789 RepID=UPI003F81AE7E